MASQFQETTLFVLMKVEFVQAEGRDVDRRRPGIMPDQVRRWIHSAPHGALKKPFHSRNAIPSRARACCNPRPPATPKRSGSP